MTGRIFTSDHRIYDLPPLLRWNVTHTGTRALRQLYGHLPVRAGAWRRCCTWRRASLALEDGRRVLLRGIVDEYTVELDGGGTDGHHHRPGLRRPAAGQ